LSTFQDVVLLLGYLFLTFFLLDQKEPKNQDKPDPSGRFVWPLPTMVMTILALTFLVYIIFHKVVSAIKVYTHER
jgi:hypothetical protein